MGTEENGGYDKETKQVINYFLLGTSIGFAVVAVVASIYLIIKYL